VGTGQACPGGDVAKADDALTAQISNIVSVLLYLAGAIAVLVIIYGGIRYVTSTGDASRIKAAKDTILYAVVGLIVAILANAIVLFVANNIGK
jgi:TRAP-type C4-dicarboxylate transport system permease small subunit